jgi:hypothetical protein
MNWLVTNLDNSLPIPWPQSHHLLVALQFVFD